MVVKFNVIDLRQIGMGQELVDDHVAERLEPHAVHPPRGAADGVTLRPRFDVIFVVRRARQHQRVARAIGGHWPGRFAVVVHFQQDGILFIAAAGNDFTDNDQTPNYPASLFLEDIHTDPKFLWNHCWADYFHKKTIILKNEPSQSTH